MKNNKRKLRHKDELELDRVLNDKDFSKFYDLFSLNIG